MRYIFQIFGSSSSIDYDVMFFVDKLGTIDENHALIKELNEEFEKFSFGHDRIKKKINSNLGILQNGQLVNVFKGTYDECNNSLFYTYDNHTQLYYRHIKKPYDRVNDDYFKHLKLKRCYRFLLSFYSRVPEFRKEIKEALKGDFKKRYEILSKINFNIHKDFPNKKEKTEDIYKVIAFQLAQTISLFKGVELYTKEDVIDIYPTLEPYINRKLTNNHDILNTHLEVLLNIGKAEMEIMADLKEEIFN